MGLSLAAIVVLGVVVIAARLVHVAHAKLDAAQRELLQLGLRANQAEAEVDAAIGRLDELRQLRVDDVQRMRDDVRELRENYERVMGRYRATQAIDGPLGSDRVQ
jgi:putative component of toxin-antitoxin plasmid stabilization module